MLGSVPGLQPPHPQQQQQQQQQQQGNPNNNIPPPPPPPPLNGQDLNLSNILHFLQSEWRRYERERNEWEIERAEMRARIALLEGERRSFENTRIDLLRRIKMLEFALRMERSKQLNQTSSQSIPPSKSAALQTQSKDDSGSHKEESNGSSPRSEDVPLPSDNRMSITSLPGMPNGVPAVGPTGRPHTWAGTNWQGGLNGNTAAAAGPLGKPPPGRDPKSRARSRDYLKQCLQEISYLTSPQAMNPLPNRPLLNNPTLPLALPNVPSFDQMAYNGRPRKIVPEVGKDFPVLNGMSIMGGGGPSSAPATSGPQVPLLERDGRMNNAGVVPLHQPHSSQQPGPGQTGSFHLQQPPLGQTLQPVQQQAGKDGDELSESQQTTAIFRPDAEWKERLRLSHEAAERARVDKLGQPGGAGVALAWDTQSREEDDEGKDEETEADDEETSIIGENDGKIWKPRRTLRNHLDAVRALAFHPTEMCLATGGDDCTVKIWRMDVAGLASTATRATTEVEPQLTLRGHTAAITRLIHAPTKRLLYSASADSSIRVWALPPAGHTTYAPYDGARARGELIGHTDAVWDLALVRDESVLVSCGAEGAVKVWDVGGRSGVGSLKLSWGFTGLDSEDVASGSRVETIGATALEAIKSDLKKVAVAYQNAAIKLFDIDSGKELSHLQGDFSQDGSPVSQVNSIASHPTLPILVTAHEDKHIRLFDIVSGQCTHSMLAHLDSVTSLSIDAAGFSLVSGGHDCSVRFWDLLGTRACVQEISSHREKALEGVLDVEFHSSLPFMASAGADGVVKLYASSS